MVFTMHCFSNFMHPELYPSSKRLPLNQSIRHGLRKSRLSLCVSKNVRDLVMERFGIPEERLPVVYNGVGDDFKPVAADIARDHMRDKHGVEGPYLVFVGQLKARKNVVRIVQAFARARRALGMPELKLVLAGRRIWTSEGIDEAIAAQGIRDSVVELGHLELDELPLVYGGAIASVFPSLWEGFGMPVIESMACGVPVVTSNLSCLPEVAGGAALLVDPYSIDEIADGMRRLVSDQALREDLRRKGLARAAQMSWRKTAERTLDAYRAVAAVPA
jgi:glycosyltransferase involved in cell wall biosynthesis